ncbi:MAG: lipopolysaccharide biosynthesis protein [Steroidobacteraceae bacterium]
MSLATSNVRWVLLSQGIKVICQMISIVVLARLLPAESYGVMALATVATGLAYLFRDLGSSAAIIQAREISPSLVSTVHWANVGLGVLLGISLAALAPLLASVFREEQLTSVLLLLSIAFPISCISIVHQALLERESRFEVVVIAEVCAAVLGVTIAVIAAWFGAGVYSLVLQVLVTTITATLIIILRSPYRAQWEWSSREFSSILGFSGNLSLFNFVNYFARNADSMVIGRLLGAGALGVYSLAYRLMLFPVQNLTFVSARALLPVLSRKQDQPSESGELYLKAVSLIAFLSAPLMAGLFTLRELFVSVTLGEKWHAVGGVLFWLAPVGFIQSMVSTTGSVSTACGRTDILLRLGIFGTLLQVSSFLIGSRWGIEGVAGGYLVANVINAVPALYFTGKLVGVSVLGLAKRVAPPVCVSLLMVAALLGTLPVVGGLFVDKRLQLLALVMVGMTAYSAFSLMFMRDRCLAMRRALWKSRQDDSA